MNETLIFQAIEHMREIIKIASSKTRSARRQQARTAAHLSQSHAACCQLHKSILKQDSAVKNTNKKPIKLFKNIEIW